MPCVGSNTVYLLLLKKRIKNIPKKKKFLNHDDGDGDSVGDNADGFPAIDCFGNNMPENV